MRTTNEDQPPANGYALDNPTSPGNPTSLPRARASCIPTVLQRASCLETVSGNLHPDTGEVA